MPGSFKDMKVYQMAYRLAMNIFEISKSFPKSQMYSLTNQIRRSSRAVCSNIAEAYRKRNYLKHFSLEYLMLIAKQVKQSSGSILQGIVATSHQKHISCYPQSMKKSAECLVAWRDRQSYLYQNDRADYPKLPLLLPF